jgi:hypothetical protein
MKQLFIISLWPIAALTAFAPASPPRAGTPIPGRYIVKLQRKNFNEDYKAARKLLKKNPAHIYEIGNFAGFAAEMTDDIVRQMRYSPGV